MTVISFQRAHWVAKELLPHEPALRSWLARRVRPPLEMDDIVQETYAVFGGMESVAHIRAPRSYMFQTAHSVFLMQVRRTNVIPFESLSDAEDLVAVCDRPSPEAEAISRHELRRVQAMIAALPARQREAFSLFKIDGLSQREVAARMDLSQSTVEKHLSKAVAALMSALGHGGNAEECASEGVRVFRIEKRSRAGAKLTD